MHLLLHIFVKLWRKLWRHVWYPLAMLWRRVFGICVLAGFGYIVSLFFESDDLGAIPEPPNIAVPRNPADGSPVAPPLKKGDNIEVQLVTKIENGNSAFSSDLISQMNAKELHFYSQTFYWVMQHQKLGKEHAWNFYNINGTLTPTVQFKNNLGDTCRRFKETLKVGETQQKIEGIACEKYGGSWCKLRPGSTPACELGRKSGLSNWWFDTQQSFKRLF